MKISLRISVSPVLLLLLCPLSSALNTQTNARKETRKVRAFKVHSIELTSRYFGGESFDQFPNAPSSVATDVDPAVVVH